jgi:hypothetical protein
MFGWFGKKSREPVEFADNGAAFSYACGSQEHRLLIHALIPALVEERGRVGAEGERWYRLKLAGPGEGIELWGCTLKEATRFPDIGELVGFRVVRIAEEFPPPQNVVGYIAVRLAPVHVPGRGWRIAANYTPDDIKPELHL